MGSVIDASRWPVVTVAITEPSELEHLADGLAEIVAREEPFALAVVAPGDIATLQRMLWAAPDSRRRMRRLRLTLAAWCEAVAHVLAPAAHAALVPSSLRSAELIWGCATIASGDAGEAEDWLRARLASRALLAGETIRTAAEPLAVPAV